MFVILPYDLLHIVAFDMIWHIWPNMKRHIDYAYFGPDKFDMFGHHIWLKSSNFNFIEGLLSLHIYLACHKFPFQFSSFVGLNVGALTITFQLAPHTMWKYFTLFPYNIIDLWYDNIST